VSAASCRIQAVLMWLRTAPVVRVGIRLLLKYAQKAQAKGSRKMDVVGGRIPAACLEIPSSSTQAIPCTVQVPKRVEVQKLWMHRARNTATSVSPGSHRLTGRPE
jgi:hypothetical protein